MRPLTEQVCRVWALQEAGRHSVQCGLQAPQVRTRMQELQTVLEKFVFFIGKNVKALFEREDEAYCFRLHKNRVFYVSERLMKRATNVRHAWY